MNVVVLMGRLTRDPEVRYSAGENPLAIARYTLAVDRRFRREGEQSADFISCVAFGRQAEFAEKYFHQGIRITVSGRIQTGSYTNRDGAKVYTTEVVVENQEFAESKAASDASRSAFAAGAQQYQAAPPQQQYQAQQYQAAPPQAAPAPYAAAPAAPAAPDDGFMNIPEGIDEELPFN